MAALRSLAVLILLATCSVVLVPGAAARHACPVADDTPPEGVGGVAGQTYSYAIGVANVALDEGCTHSAPTLAELLAAADRVADLTCQYLLGRDCL